MHERVREAYRSNGFPIPTSPAEEQEKVFRRRTQRAKLDDLKRIITQVWRTSTGPGKDFIFYEQQEILPDPVGNEEVFTSYVGRYQMPKFKKTYDNATGEISATHVSGHDEIYDIPYSPQKMKEILDSGDSSRTIFTLMDNRGGTYGGFAADDFVNKSQDELVSIGLHGFKSPASKELVITEEEEEEIIAAERAKERFRRMEAAQRQRNEELKNRALEQFKTKPVEEEATAVTQETQDGQETVVKQSSQEETPLTTTTTAAIAKIDTGARPEKELVKEEVGFVLQKEDLEADEDEIISKEFQQQDEDIKKTKKVRK